MSDEPDHLMLRMLRGIDTKMDRVIDEVADLKVRMTAVEEGLAGVNRRLDRADARVDRTERRLNLSEGVA